MNGMTRRNLLRLSTLGAVNALAQNGASDYKALVCVFLLGGNDGNNMVVPLTQADYDAYRAARGGLALPDVSARLLAVESNADGKPYGLNDGLTAIHPLWAQGKLAVVANMGNLVKPTTRAEYLANANPVPTNLFSHSDQMAQMQSGYPNTGGGTGWAGRVADAANGLNGAATFPASVSIAGPALFCTGGVVQSASLIPDFNLGLYGMDLWPATAGEARKAALQELLTFDSGMALVQAANRVRQDALSLNAMLAAGGSNGTLTTVFPGTSIGRQLRQVARIIQLRGSTGMKRQVFFCALGGFDTHGAQAWMHWDLLTQLGNALGAFYQATVEMGVAGQVTVQGRGVNGSSGVFGRYPELVAGGPDDIGLHDWERQGRWIPTMGVDQYAGTLLRWFGATPGQIAGVLPHLSHWGQDPLPGFL